MPMKRSRVLKRGTRGWKGRGGALPRGVNTAMRVGNWASLAGAARVRGRGRLAARVNRIERAIETKEGCRRVTNFQCSHNNLTVLNDANGNVFNPFISTNGVGDPMGAGEMVRIGDSVRVIGLSFKFFLEASLGRSKVYFRIMLIKMAKGDTLNRANFFKGACDNKMIDQYNKERFTIVAQKIVNVSASNNVATSLVVASGVPLNATTGGMTGNKIVSMWIPGRKFGRGGQIQWENGQGNQLKFFDYRLAVVSYDWYGTPQDINNVGFINDGFVKVYFKDA